MERGSGRSRSPGRAVAIPLGRRVDPTRFMHPCTAPRVKPWDERPRPGWAGDSAATWRSPSPTWAGRSVSPRRPVTPGRVDRAAAFARAVRRTMCWRGWTEANCRRAASGMSPSTALMVLRNPEPGRRVRVGGLHWASTRLYPLVKAACPDHPLIRETRREVLDDLLDAPAAERWLTRQPAVRFRVLPAFPRSPPPGSSRASPIPCTSNPPAECAATLARTSGRNDPSRIEWMSHGVPCSMPCVILGGRVTAVTDGGQQLSQKPPLGDHALEQLGLASRFPWSSPRVAILTNTSQCETVISHGRDLASWAQGLRGVVP